MKNLSRRTLNRYAALLISILLLAAGLLWQMRFAGIEERGMPSIVETASPGTPQPASVTEAPATPFTQVGAAASPVPQRDQRPLWATLARDVRLIGGLQRLDEKVPKSTTLRVLGNIGDQLLVHYAGDDIDHEATDGLVDAADIAATSAPKWVMVRWAAALRSTPDQSSPIVSWLQPGAVLETLYDGKQTLRVYYSGNGRERKAAEGWVDVENLVAAGPTLAAESRGARWLDKKRIDRLYSGDGVWLKLPYRTQLDGSPPAPANCGPASIGMILEYFGVPATNAELRSIAHSLQRTSGADTGFAIEHLMHTVELLGMNGLDLYAGKEFRKWSLDDLRGQIISGRPVVPQLRFRMMPGRGHSDYWEDHYVVLCGVQGSDFIYSDPVDIEGPGFGRLISGEGLEQAWGASFSPFAAFAVGSKEPKEPKEPKKKGDRWRISDTRIASRDLVDED